MITIKALLRPRSNGACLILLAMGAWFGNYNLALGPLTLPRLAVQDLDLADLALVDLDFEIVALAEVALVLAICLLQAGNA